MVNTFTRKREKKLSLHTAGYSDGASVTPLNRVKSEFKAAGRDSLPGRPGREGKQVAETQAGNGLQCMCSCTFCSVMVIQGICLPSWLEVLETTRSERKESCSLTVP